MLEQIITGLVLALLTWLQRQADKPKVGVDARSDADLVRDVRQRVRDYQNRIRDRRRADPHG